MGENLREIFVENLKRYMEMKEKSQADLMRYMKVSSATASDWVNGRKLPRADKLQAIADWLGIQLSDLLEEKKPETPYYLNEETAAIAQQVFEDPALRLLFDAARDAKPENIRLAAEMLKRFKETNPDG